MQRTAAIAPTFERLTWEQICARYPDEWVVLVDVDWIDSDCDMTFRTAVVLGHSKTSSECLSNTRALVPIGSEAAHLFTGDVVAPIVSYSMP